MNLKLNLHFTSLLFLVVATTSQADTIGKPGGVTHSPPRSQVAGQICVEYALSGLAESEYSKLSGKKIHLSPEYMGFYHFYLQLQNRLGYFRKLAKDAADAPSTLDEIKNKVLGEFDFGPGSTGATGLKEVLFTGMIPINFYFDRIEIDDQERRLETALHDFVSQYMLDLGNLNRYAITDDFGMSKNLITDLSKFLTPALGFTPMLPTDHFNFEGKTYTPRSFMKTFLHFDPTKFQAFVSTPKTHDLAIAAVSEALKNNIAVPIGIELFNDQKDFVGAFSRAITSGTFTENDCPDKICKEIYGGHEGLAVNFITGNNPDKTSELIFKSSWGHRGLDVNGAPNKDRYQTGYFRITSEYLRASTSSTVNEPWDFIIPKIIAKSFKGLKTSLPRN